MKNKKHSLRDDIGYWLNRLRMVVHASFEKKLTSYGITVPQWCVLVSLFNKDADSVGSLASFIDVDKGSISRVVEQLVQLDLVERVEGKDRRSIVVKLTSEGKALSPKLIQCAKTNEDEFFSILNSKEKGSLKHLLSRLLNNAGIEQLGGCLGITKKENSNDAQ